MYLTKVAPISRIPRPSPQFLSYFTKEKLKRGSLVLIPLRKKKVKAVVFSQEEAIEKKMDIKKASYAIKPIIKVVQKNPILDENQIKLAKWMADYYWASFGKVLSLFLRNSKKVKEKIETKTSFEKKLIIAPEKYFPEKEMKKVLLEKKEILFLVPEKTKEKFWKEKLGKYKSPNLIVKTRTGLFQSFASLALIILTQEGNQSYKSQMEPRYEAKKTAEKLAEIWQARLICLSSFPSTESYYKDKKIKIKTNEKEIKKEIIDMQKIKPWKPLSDKLILALEKNTKEGKKTLLFLQRRGTATTLLCRDCGWIQKCQDCNVPMVYHQTTKTPSLLCHYCDKENQVPRLCKRCQSWNLDTLGVGVEKIEKTLKEVFPKEKILRIDSEITKTKEEQKKALFSFLEEKKGGILLTTSMVFQYFPLRKVPLVGIISLDALLSQPDFKIEEESARIVKKLLAVSKENFIIQTFFPKAKAINWIKKDQETFFKKALKERKEFSYPPFSTLIKLSLNHKNPTIAESKAHLLKKEIEEKTKKEKKYFEIVGPAPAFIEKIKGKHHWKILIKLKTKDKKIKNKILAQIPPFWKIDVDPEKIV